MSVCLCVYMCDIFFICSSIYGYLSPFHIVWLLWKAIINMVCRHLFCHTFDCLFTWVMRVSNITTPHMEVHFQRSNLREAWENTHNVFHVRVGIHIWLYFHTEITKQTNTKHDDFLEEGKNGGENRIHTSQNTSCSLDLLSFGNSAQLYSNYNSNNKMKC